ncbi:MAG: hypothetical protein QM492_10190 [Rhodobacterales bacterium]
MDSHPKVMTVSYGTFTCTLDGFNDPFTTMQLVAEYFRKLSADDRYFGSEPLQPDASKLHQIARDANPNRIDAEVSDNSIILRQADIVDVPSKVNTVDKIVPAQPAEETVANKPVAKDTAKTPAQEAETEFSTCRRVKATEKPVKTKAETTSDTLITALEDNVNDIETADELAPTLDQEIPSETVSAALQALKGGEAIDRWLETTNEKMTTPEHVSKANALERLKAAVAATEAERSTRMKSIAPDVTIETGEERRDNTISFRRELAKVRKAYDSEASVFFRPKARRAARKQTNGNTRPLVLDMGQRISQNLQTSDDSDFNRLKKKVR